MKTAKEMYLEYIEKNGVGPDPDDIISLMEEYGEKLASLPDGWKLKLHAAAREYMDGDRSRRNSWDFEAGGEWVVENLIL